MGASTAERREVAKRLRAYNGDGMALRHLCRSLGLRKSGQWADAWPVVFDRIADLIDPGEAEEGGDE